MNARDQVNEYLREYGAVLQRKRKHEVWKFPDGKVFVRAATPSDSRADDNNLSDLKKLLGLTKTVRTEGERREPRNKPGNLSAPRMRLTLAEQLQPVQQSMQLQEAQDALSEAIAELEAIRLIELYATGPRVQRKNGRMFEMKAMYFKNVPLLVGDRIVVQSTEEVNDTTEYMMVELAHRAWWTYLILWLALLVGGDYPYMVMLHGFTFKPVKTYETLADEWEDE